MSARSPKLAHDGSAGDAEAVAIVQDMLGELKKIDPRLVLHPWNPLDKDHRPTPRFHEITQKTKLAKYTDKLWVREGETFYIRFEIGHDVDRHLFESEDLKRTMRNKDCFLSPDQVQDRKVVCAGWFLGSYPKTFNSIEFVPALQAHPLIGGRDIKIRTQDFRLQRASPYSQKIPAVHLFCRQNEARTIRAALNRIYGSEKNGGLPAGRNMKFIPSTTEPTLPPTGNMLNKAKIAAAKQKRFLSCMVHTLTDTIMDLDVFVDQGGINATLREITMCMKTSDGDSNMFAAVDTTWDGKVAFVYHRDYDPEVSAVVPFLPLILEARFDDNIWIWFTPETKDINAGFYWDPATGTVKSSEDDHLDAAIQDFDGYEPFEHFEDQDNESVRNENETPIRFDLALQICLDAPRDTLPVYQMGTGSVGTFRHELPSTSKPASVSTDTTMTDTSSLTHDSFTTPHTRLQNDSSTAGQMSLE
jgi:hypothetical protein